MATSGNPGMSGNDGSTTAQWPLFFIELQGEMMKSWKRSIHAFVWSVALLVPASLTSPAFAQDAGAETSAVRAYVARTREISATDYRIDRQPDAGNLSIYRITLNPEVAGFVPAERVFDISVSKQGSEVVGESTVELTE